MQYCLGLEERLAVGFGLSLFLRDPNGLRRKFCARRGLPRGYLDLSHLGFLFSRPKVIEGPLESGEANDSKENDGNHQFIVLQPE